MPAGLQYSSWGSMLDDTGRLFMDDQSDALTVLGAKESFVAVLTGYGGCCVELRGIG